jgi:hypothetical protein
VINGKISGFQNGDNVRLILTPSPGHSGATMFANLLEVSEPHNLTICGHLNAGKDEPFMGQIVNVNAPEKEICRGTDFLAKAQLQ